MVDAATDTEPRTGAISTRLLAEGDVDAVHEIDQASYVDPWPATQIAVEVERDDRCHVVAVRSIGGAHDAQSREVIVGHASLLIVKPEATLTTVAVAVDHRGSGVATHLLLDLFDRAVDLGIEAITLEVRSRNRAAHRLYYRFGFAPAGVRRGYYPAGRATPADDALIMWATEIHEPEFQQRLATIADDAHYQRPISQRRASS